MKKIIFGIFAHPDDEAFGPAGALLLETQSGADLHLITLTNGDAGMNPDNHEDLGTLRLTEWRKAGELIGAKSMHPFGYKDGELNNKSMIKIGQQIVDLVLETVSSAPPDAIIEFMTLDLNGYTGHIDHIVTARAASLAFFTLKQADTRFTSIRFACLPRSLYPSVNIDWLYMEPGRAPNEINQTIDARPHRDKILAVMHVHHSQRADCAATLKSQGEDLGLNYFIVKTNPGQES